MTQSLPKSFYSPPLLSSDLLISLTVPPMLLGILGSYAAAKTLHQLGQISEEVFRGDRLPVLSVLETQASD